MLQSSFPFRLLLCLAALAILQPTQVFATESAIYTSRFSNSALAGYDTVAYFTEGKAVKGSKKFQTTYNGANWLFSSETNLNLFIAAPEDYAPQYGGYCAWAVANNDTAKGDPKQWTIHNGKLYLNYNAKVQSIWLKDNNKYIDLADDNWPGVLQ